MKKILSIITALLLIVLPLSACNDNNIKTIRLNEVTHSVFYAPLYVAIENGYFENENIKIELTNGGGADKVMTALLSDGADIGLMGPESTIYVYNQGKKDYPVTFAQLTQRDGSFLVSRQAEPNFKWSDLQGKEVLAGRRGGVPAMTFEYMMKENGLYNGKDFTMNFDVQFNLMTSAFINGTADYCTVFEPTASEYQAQGLWHIVASVGEGSGEIPYTSFIANQSYIKNNEEIIKSFMKAILKGIEFINENSDTTIAQAIVKQFPDTTINSIATSINSYKKINAWTNDLVMSEASFDRLQNIMINAGELTEKVPFIELVDNSFAISLQK